MQGTSILWECSDKSERVESLLLGNRRILDRRTNIVAMLEEFGVTVDHLRAADEQHTREHEPPESDAH
jgi:hypothetical protein